MKVNKITQTTYNFELTEEEAGVLRMLVETVVSNCPFVLDIYRAIDPSARDIAANKWCIEMAPAQYKGKPLGIWKLGSPRI